MFTVLGRGFKSVIGACDMAKDMKKKLLEELEVINKSLKGSKCTIESANTITDIPTNNSRGDLFQIVKELYAFSKKAVSYVQSTTTSATSSNTAPSDIQAIVKQQLTDVLPGLLRDALQEHSNQVQTPKEETPENTIPAVSTSHTLVIERIPDGGEENKITDAEWTTVVKKDVKGALKTVPVIKAAPPTNGAAKLHFRSKADLDEAQEALKSKYKVTSKSQEKKSLDPKLTISGIDPDITTKEMLEEKILEKNQFIRDLKEEEEMFKIVFYDLEERFAVVQVSTKIRESIRRKNDKICIDLEQYPVRDRFHVVQCYHCQEYGHTSGSPYCKQKDSDGICFYCAGKHASKDCKNKKDKKTGSIKCANCAKSKNRGERSKCSSHKASDSLCPFFIREKERIMNRTVGSTEAKNVYLQKVKELQKKYGRV